MIDLAHLAAMYLPKQVTLTHALLLFFLIFTRWVVMSAIMPFLGAQLLPSPVRFALAAMLAMVSFMLLLPTLKPPTDINGFLLAALFLKEGLIGFVLGFIASLLFYTYELFGELIDLARAASMAKLFVPEMKHQSSPMGTMFFQLALVFFLSLGLHRPLIDVAYRSFVVFPPMSLAPNFLHDGLRTLTMKILHIVFSLAFEFALPIVLICFLIDLAFGLMNRVAPQINAYFLSLPAKIISGLIMLFFLIPFLLDDFVSHQQELSRGLDIFFSVPEKK